MSIHKKCDNCCCPPATAFAFLLFSPATTESAVVVVNAAAGCGCSLPASPSIPFCYSEKTMSQLLLHFLASCPRCKLALLVCVSTSKTGIRPGGCVCHRQRWLLLAAAVFNPFPGACRHRLNSLLLLFLLPPPAEPDFPGSSCRSFLRNPPW